MPVPLALELETLPGPLAERLAAHRFDRAHFLALAARLGVPGQVDNRVPGALEAPREEDLVELPAAQSADAAALREAGLGLLREGRCALVVMAGGMATRMGNVVKALVEALPGRSFLDLRLAEQRALSRLAGRPVPLWLMTSAATDAPIRAALGSRLDGEHVAVFTQRLSLRLTPEGGLFRDAAGHPSEHAPGHGDLVDSLRDSGLLGRFLARGGTGVTVANLDNLGATLDPAVLGFHAAGRRAVTCEVVDKVDSDRGGIPVRHAGRTVVLEEFRIPEAFDPAQVRVFSTNTFHFDARALNELSMRWSYFAVTKQVEGHTAIQFERLLNEVTSHMDTTYLRVPRASAGSRFLPVKDPEELALRKGDIEVVARARGMLP